MRTYAHARSMRMHTCTHAQGQGRKINFYPQKKEKKKKSPRLFDFFCEKELSCTRFRRQRSFQAEKPAVCGLLSVSWLLAAQRIEKITSFFRKLILNRFKWLLFLGGAMCRVSVENATKRLKMACEAFFLAPVLRQKAGDRGQQTWKILSLAIC